MGIATEKYIRKPLYVDAVRITEENFDEIVAWVPGEVQHEGEKKFIRVRVANPKVPRQTKAYVGDWILWTERGGHKVYTPKAFKAAFDKVMTTESEAETPQGLKGPEGPSVVTPPTRIEEVEGKEVSVVTEDPNPETGVQPILDIRESPEMTQARETIETEGGTVEAATPEAIAEVVNEQQPKVQVDEGIAVSDSPTAPPTDDHGKRVLTVAEQQTMRREEITDLIRSGEVVLEQDLAA